MQRMLIIMIGLILCACRASELSPNTGNGTYNAELANRLGADAYGMKPYIHVVLKTGPHDKTIVDPKKRNKIFKGHFSNMATLAKQEKLVLAGPFDDKDGDWRGLYIFNVKTIEDAKALVQTDPAVAAGIFTAEYTPYYGSAALMQINELHQSIQKIKIE